jgi:hypothetical protein
MNVSPFTFDQLNSALLDCSSYHLTKEQNEDGELAYALRDGCGDQDGDLFEDLFDVQDYITNNEQIADYLANDV